MLFDDDHALRTAIGLFRSTTNAPTPATIHRQKSSSSEMRSPTSRSDSVDLDLHALYSSPRSFRDALDMMSSSGGGGMGGGDDDDDALNSNNNPLAAQDGGQQEDKGGAGRGGDPRRSISVVVTSSVDLVIERVSKETIEKRAAEKRTSALSDALNAKKSPSSFTNNRPSASSSSNRGGGGGTSTPTLFSPDEVVHRITVYLPDRTPIQLRVPESMTFHEVIRQVLYTVRSNPSLSARIKLGDNPGNYEFRMHEGEGEADEDFPALDRSSKVKHFGDTTTHEYCLREIVRPGGGTSSISSATTAAGRSMSPPPPSAPKDVARPSSASSPPPRRMSPTPPMSTITVLLPNQTSIKVEVVAGKTTIQDVLTKVLKAHHRLQFSTEQFCLHYSEATAKRQQQQQRGGGGVASSIMGPLDGNALVTDLMTTNSDQLVLRRKVFADDPASLSQGGQEGSNVSFQQQGGERGGARNKVGLSTKHQQHSSSMEEEEERRPDPESFVFTAETAFVYKEWTVIKKNKFGRKQTRVMGMDDSKIYNYKRDSKGNRRTDGVYRAERPIATVRAVEFVEEDIKALRIQFEEDGTLNVVEYSAVTAYDCAEIVYKLRYVMEAIARVNRGRGGGPGGMGLGGGGK